MLNRMPLADTHGKLHLRDLAQHFIAAGALLIALVAAIFAAAPAFAADPIRIGFGMALTGPLAPNGKSALLAMKLWEEDINAKGGLLGRPVKLVYYDDQSNPATVPGIYSKLLDVDKVELVVGGYATNMVAPALPLMIQKKKVFIGLFGLAVNEEFKYPNYFAMMPAGGASPKAAFSKGFFEAAMQVDPKPQTIAIVAADAEFAIHGAEGARESIKEAGLKIVYDKSYPQQTADFAPIIRAVAATNPDLVCVFSYPVDTAGIVRAVNEIGYKPKMLGCGMVGLQATALKTQLGPLLNGIVNFDFWLPAPTMKFPGIMALIERYQAKAAGEGVDALGYYMAPFAYAYLQVMGQAIEATKSLEDQKLADYIRATTHKTVVGDIKFGKNGEWAEARVLGVQFQNVKGNGIEQFKDASTLVVVAPASLKSGNVIYPFENARK